MNFEHSIALVTGANRGLGQSLVLDLVQRGVRRVYATARSSEALERLKELHPKHVVPLRLDVTSDESVAAAANLAGDVNLLVNNAGSLASFGVLSSSADDVRSDMETNFFGPLRAARAFAPVLEKNGPAALVNVLSVASLASMPAIGGYSASKAAALSLTQALRAELGKRGVTVHAAYPGPIDTDMIRNFTLAKTSPDDVARAILQGVSSREIDIYPDPVARDVSVLWQRDPRAVERRFSEG
jgi:NAD(P)-dependent dehydrogenase (short-subunit alcohol dehydrogenase family)